MVEFMENSNEENLDLVQDAILRSVPQLSINTVIFRFHDQQLQFAAVKLINGNLWYIPGGYVYQDESIDEAAKRNLYEQTLIDNLILYQFGSFGSSERKMKTDIDEIQQLGLSQEYLDWIGQRFVTIAYYSVIADPDAKIKEGSMYSSGKWLNIDNKYKFAMDHGEIVAEARKALARDLLSRPILSSFLPAEFTIPELQKLYEAILGRPVDRGNFRKRILKLDIIAKTGEVKGNTGQRPPELYRLNKTNYLNSLTEDVKLGF